MTALLVKKAHDSVIEEAFAHVFLPQVNALRLVAGGLAWQCPDLPETQFANQLWDSTLGVSNPFENLNLDLNRLAILSHGEAVNPSALTVCKGSGQLTLRLYVLPVLPGGSDFLLVLALQKLCPQEIEQLQVATRGIACLLKLLKTQIQHQSRIDYLEHLLRSIEHQMRQSFGLVKLYLPLLESQLDAQGKFWFDGFRSTITELSARLTSMVADRSDRGCGASQVELGALIGERCQALSPLIREKSLQINYPDGKLWLPSDVETFSQVVDNLLCNAIAFSPEGGSIIWSWEAFDQEVLVTLRDSGPGLRTGEEQKIFRSGYTHRPGGQGQGLAIAKRIVTHLGGRIWAETLEVGGAQFSLVLPLTPRPA